MPRHPATSLVILNRVKDKSADQKRIFIETLERVATVTVACKAAGCSVATAYRWRSQDEQFEQDWDNALRYAIEALESATYLKLGRMLENARQRISMPEARLIEMFLAGAFPEKYKQANRIDVDITQLNVTIDWSKIPDDMVQRFNANQITLQDVYDYWALQSKTEARSDTSQD